MCERTFTAIGDTRVRAPIQVAVAANSHYLMPLAVTLRSLASAHEAGELAVTVLHDGLRQFQRSRIECGLSELHVTWLQVPLRSLEYAQYPPHLTRESLFRLLLPEMLPTEMDRVIYLDADTLVTETLRPFWDTELTNYYAGAVRDAGIPFAAGPFGLDWRAHGLEPDDPYFNAGVLLIALDAWRHADVSQRALDLLRQATLKWADQDALNVVLRGHWKELPRRWNLQTLDVQGAGLTWALWRDDIEPALLDAAVIHYSGHVKPWHADSRHPFDSLWFEVLAETYWRNWRPDPTRPLYRRIGSRTKSAWQVLTAGPSGAQVS